MRVGPLAVIEGAVVVGARSYIHAQARLIGPMTLGVRNVVHGHAVLGDDPQDRKYTRDQKSDLFIGDDNVFREGVTIHRGTGNGTKTVIGNRCYFMVNSHVGHNCVVADDVTMVNNSALGGHVHVGERAIIGANSAIHQFCRVGRLAMLSNGAGMQVDMPPFFICMSTNHVTQLNAVGLRRSGVSRESINAIRQMFQLAFRRRGKPIKGAMAALPPELLAVPEVKEMFDFVHSAKRGVAKFQAWSRRSATVEAPSNS